MPFRLLDQFDVKRKIEQGDEGKVYEATRKRDGRKVAIKLARSHGDGYPREITNNRLLKQHGIRGVNHMYEYEIAKDNSYMMVLEYMPCDLFYFLEKNMLCEKECRYIIEQVVHILIDMSNKAGIMYVDVKPENILIDPTTLKIQLCDFSGCIPTSDIWTDISTYSRTICYLPPESLNRNRFYPCRSIVWSIGILAFSILPGVTDIPWEEYRPGLVETLKFPRNTSQDARDFVLTCLEEDVIRRLDLRDLVYLRWMNKRY